MNLADILGREQILPDLRAADRWEAIDELVGLLVATGRIKAADRDCVASVIKKREHSMSTGMGFGLAFPTATTDVIGNVVMALGRSRKGVEFDALDRQPVKIVMLVLVPMGPRQENLNLLHTLSEIFNFVPFRQAIEQAPDAAAIHEIFSRREKDLTAPETA